MKQSDATKEIQLTFTVAFEGNMNEARVQLDTNIPITEREAGFAFIHISEYIKMSAKEMVGRALMGIIENAVGDGAAVDVHAVTPEQFLNAITEKMKRDANGAGSQSKTEEN